MSRRRRTTASVTGVMANSDMLGWTKYVQNCFPSTKPAPPTWDPQAHGVTEAGLELVRVEPGLREAATEAGVQALTQKWWQPLGGKQSSGNVLDISTPEKEPLTSEWTCDKILYLTPCCLPGYEGGSLHLRLPHNSVGPLPYLGTTSQTRWAGHPSSSSSVLSPCLSPCCVLAKQQPRRGQDTCGLVVPQRRY